MIDRWFKKVSKPSFYRKNQDCNPSKFSRTEQLRRNQ